MSAANRLAMPDCASLPSAWNQGATMLRQTEVEDRVAGSAARNPAQSERSTQPAIAAKFAWLRPISAGKPPMRSAQFSPSSASSTSSMEGVLMVSPLKMPSSSLPPLVSRKSFGSGQDGTWLCSRSTARGPKASMPCCASPPSTFCQDQVATSSLSQGSSMAKAAEVASQMTSPSRSDRIQSPLGTRAPEVVPFQVKTTSRLQSTWARSGSAP